MSENRDILVLESLCGIGTTVEALSGELRDLRHRVTRAEHQLAALTAAEAVHHAATAVRLDHLQVRLDRLDPGPETPGPPTAT